MSLSQLFQEVPALVRPRIVLAALCLGLLSVAPIWPAPRPAQPAAQASAAAPTVAQLQALSGEYTDPNEPDTPLSFYVNDGKLIVESERNIPTELKAISDTEFNWLQAKFTVRFTLDAAGKGNNVVFSDTPNNPHRRTGPPVHHIFHDYQRSEVMIPMRDGVKLHAVILKPADIAAPLPFLIDVRKFVV
jgi:hypothetical protein